MTTLEKLNIIVKKIKSPNPIDVSIPRGKSKIIVDTASLDREDIDNIYYMIRDYATKKEKKIKNNLIKQRQALSFQLMKEYA